MERSTVRTGGRLELGFVAAEGGPQRVFEEAVRHDSSASRLTWWFRGYYSFVRPVLPLPMRQRIQRWRGVESDDSGLFPHEFMARLVDALSGEGIEVVHPWPRGRDYGLTLTHDVESESGLRRCLEVAAIEEELGFRSSFNLVPFAYPSDA
ncbi:MAG: hypothetical protein OEO23_15240, partial [Gemmatimonadota bacterium]|nr:hypothetical protein [Gemmatimonadota bacterium]